MAIEHLIEDIPCAKPDIETAQAEQISSLGHTDGQIWPSADRSYALVYEADKDWYRAATAREIALIKPTKLEDLKAKLRVDITKYPWARKMGPQ